MLNGDNSTVRIVSVGVQLLAVGVLGLVAATAMTAAFDRLETARTLATIAGALAVVVLTAVTGWYASRTERYVSEAQTLRRRPYVKRIVAVGLDRVLQWLEDCQQQWDVTDPPAGMPVYPEIDDVTVAEDVVADISREHPDLVSDVSEYLTASREYRAEWQALHADLSQLIRTRFALEDQPESIDVVIGERYAHLDAGDDVDPSMAPDAFIRANAELFARFVLTNPEPSAPEPPVLDVEEYAELLFDAYRTEFVNLRGVEAVAEQVELVHRLREDLSDDAEELFQRLQDVRSEYVAEYDIMETELGEIKDGGRAAI